MMSTEQQAVALAEKHGALRIGGNEAYFMIAEENIPKLIDAVREAHTAELVAMTDQGKRALEAIESLDAVIDAMISAAPTTEAQVEPVLYINPRDIEALKLYSKQCSAVIYRENSNTRIPLYTTPPASAALVEATILREREECARVCDFLEQVTVSEFSMERRFANNRDLAAAIRARGRAALEAEKKDAP